MVKEHDKSQEKDDSCHSDQFGKRIGQRYKSFLIFCIAAVLSIAIILWGIKSFSPSASESTSGSKSTFVAKIASKQKAADFLKKELLEITDLLVEEFPENERLRTLAVETHQVCLNHIQARALLEEGIGLNPGYGEFYDRLARIAAKNGEHAEAIAYWKKTLELSPERSDLNVKISEALMSSGKYRQAIEILQKHIKKFPESALSYYLLGQSYLQLKEYDQSRKYFEKAIEILPDHPQANYGLATVYIRLKQRDKARQHLEIHKKWRQSRVDSRKAYAGSDLTGVLSDSLDKEFILFSKFLAKLYLQGAGLYRADQEIEKSEELLRRGEKAFERAIEISPEQPDVYRDLSFMYIVTGSDLTKAIELAEKAVGLQGSAENYYTLFGAYNRSLDPGKAMKALVKAIELDPGNLQYRKTYDRITKGKK